MSFLCAHAQVKVINKGQMGLIGMGFVTDDVILNRLPGWEPHSYGGWGWSEHTPND
jgi:hypothetical protein